MYIYIYIYTYIYVHRHNKIKLVEFLRCRRNNDCQGCLMAKFTDLLGDKPIRRDSFDRNKMQALMTSF